MFNRLVGRKAALVYNTPNSHVTRDFKEAAGRLSDLHFKLIDTSGLEPFMDCGSIQGRATRLTRQVRRICRAATLAIAWQPQPPWSERLGRERTGSDAR